jgi:hypothetical protein
MLCREQLHSGWFERKANFTRQVLHILQLHSQFNKYVNVQEGKDSCFILGWETRRNVINSMFERIIKVESCIKDSLIELGVSKLQDGNNICYKNIGSLESFWLALGGLTGRYYSHTFHLPVFYKEWHNLFILPYVIVLWIKHLSF